MSFDPRITPARPDLAAAHLRGKVEAARFVEGTEQEVIVGIAPVRSAPSHDAPLVTEALRGERVTVYETDEEGWAWGQLAVRRLCRVAAGRGAARAGRSADAQGRGAADLRVSRAFDQAAAARRAAARRAGCALRASRIASRSLRQAAIVPKRHLAALDTKEADFVAVAERFVGAPYLWGGKSSLGLDCSGLVQVALTACGIPCPRDSDMQEKALGKAASLAGLQSGDLIFWKGHVAIARGRNSMIHANAFHMAVAIEPVGEAVARIARGRQPGHQRAAVEMKRSESAGRYCEPASPIEVRIVRQLTMSAVM